MGCRELGRFAEPSLYILVSLSEGPKHGYAIMTDVEAISGVPLGPGTLYGALSRLERARPDRGARPEDRRRPYRLTPLGASDAGAPSWRAWPASPGRGCERLGRPTSDARPTGLRLYPMPELQHGSPAEALTGPALRARRALQVAGTVPTAAAPPALAAGIGLVAARGGRRHARVRLVCARSDRRQGPGRDAGRPHRHQPGPPDLDGFPVYVREAARAFVILVDPARGGWQPGSRPDPAMGHDPQRPGPLPGLPAPRLPAKPVHRGLLVPLPMPSIAVRPPRDQGRRRAFRAGTARNGSFRHRGGCGRRPDDRYGADHPRTAAGCPRPAGRHPAEGRERMRMNALLRLYPGAWRARYGEEMEASSRTRPLGSRDRLDLGAWRDRRLAPPLDTLA